MSFTDYTIVKNVLIAAGWRRPWEVADMSDEDCRNTLIVELHNRSTDSISSLQGRSNAELAGHGLMYLWLVEAQIRTPQELAQMSLDHHRNTTIVENHKHLQIPIWELQARSNFHLVELANKWWLPSHLRPVIDAMQNVSGSSVNAFNLRDDLGSGMDTLKVLRVGNSYLGIYHTMGSDGSFRLRIAESSGADLRSWKMLVELGAHSHQGDIKRMGDGFVVVNEEDAPGRGNNIRVRHYTSRASLIANEHSHSISLPRQFSATAEGTPNIISIHGTGPHDSVIFIGFHFFRDQVVDRQAYGVLKNFQHWTAWKNEVANTAVEDMGYNGNIGGRYNFIWQGRTWTVMEAQWGRNDWASWRILIGNGRFFHQLDPRTPSGSTAFANPSVTEIGEGRYVATDFLPSEGARGNEAGELLYEFTA